MQAVQWLVRYLIGNSKQGYCINPKSSQGVEVHVDADFSGNWNASRPEMDKDTTRSQYGYMITYIGASIVQKSQLQIEIALSSTESEYTGLSYALREVISIMNMIKEMKNYSIHANSKIPTINYKVFEDNSGALEMATIH